MPASSWFHKLRRRRRTKRSSACGDLARAADGPASQRQALAAAARATPGCDGDGDGRCCYSPNRASYYFPTADRARPADGAALRCITRRDGGGDGDDGTALDVRVDVVHRRADRLDGTDAPPATPELKLRRIVTRPAGARNEPCSPDSACSSSATTSAATTPSTRARGFHVKLAGRRRRSNALKEKAAAAAAAAEPLHVGAATRRRRWLYDSLVVVKASSEPERELAESMAEMVAANGIRSPEDLEELLACYLALNAAEHHRAVVAAFRRVWLNLARHQRAPHD